MELNGRILIVMGVSGCGKSTIAQEIARLLGTHFKDGDELHPESNIAAMERGQPLTDEDRLPWLAAVRDYACTAAHTHNGCVIACSALKKVYRDILDQAGEVHYVYLEGSQELIASRMRKRKGHFMPESLLDSQFAALEVPNRTSNLVTVSIEPVPDVIAANAVSALQKLFAS